MEDSRQHQRSINRRLFQLHETITSKLSDLVDEPVGPYQGSGYLSSYPARVSTNRLFIKRPKSLLLVEDRRDLVNIIHKNTSCTRRSEATYRVEAGTNQIKATEASRNTMNQRKSSQVEPLYSSEERLKHDDIKYERVAWYTDLFHWHLAHLRLSDCSVVWKTLWHRTTNEGEPTTL